MTKKNNKMMQFLSKECRLILYVHHGLSGFLNATISLFYSKKTGLPKAAQLIFIN